MATFEQFLKSVYEEEGTRNQGKLWETVACKWILENHPEYKDYFKKVWNFRDFPKKWNSEDLGTDLIAEDIDGKYWAIQAKRYDETSYVNKKSLESFYSDSDKEIISMRLLIATTDKIHKNALVTLRGSSKGFKLLDRTSLKNDITDYPSSINNLRKTKPHKKHTPRPYQKAAIKDVVTKINKRGQLIMACGTGKTNTGQWIAEELNAKTTLVLFPSLLLLSKTLRDWKLNENVKNRFLPVCSDETVSKSGDETVINTHELAYPTTTNPDEIAEFLKKKGHKVIFSTYQSAPEIAKAYKKHKLKPFDLMICDEAHRCAGKVSGGYEAVLDDKKIPSQKRLFMTATPRIPPLSTTQLLKARGITYASMDDESLFGPVLHRLSFSDAIKQDKKGNSLLTDYQIVVMGVKSESLKSLIDERSFIKLENELESDAHSIATKIAFLSSIKKYNLERIITFHTKVKDAKKFSLETPVVQSVVKDTKSSKTKITSDYIDGLWSTARRNEKLNSLAVLENEKTYVLSNARCLSEGVDVPALDAISFVAPRRSEVDIVQAVGRAIRKSENKKIGTVLIPIVIDESLDIDQQFQDSTFDQVWKVVNALRAHDDVLGRQLDNIRIKLAKQKKPTFKDTKIHFDHFYDIDQRIFEKLALKVVEFTTENWIFWISLLEDYKSQHGDINVPASFKINGNKLGSWLDKQRQNYKNTLLAIDRIADLEKLGIVWDPLESAWQFGYEKLKEYKKINNDDPSASIIFKDFNLGVWVRAQRNQYRIRKLKPDRIEKLNKLGFNFNPSSGGWNRPYQMLVNFNKTNGHSSPRANYIVDGFHLGSWCSNQRMIKKGKSRNQKLSKTQIKLLNQIGFDWDPKETAWNTNFEALKKYKHKFGHSYLKRNERFEGLNLDLWCQTQRRLYFSGRLNKSRQKKLNQLNFIWNKQDHDWDIAFDIYIDFLKVHKRQPKQSEVYKEMKIGLWITVQRRKIKENAIDSSRKTKLINAGFELNPKLDNWSNNYRLAKEFFIEYEHLCPIGKEIFKGFNIGNWISRQRVNFRSKKLTATQISSLNSIGMVWNKRDIDWLRAFNILCNFKKDFGHANPPRASSRIRGTTEQKNIETYQGFKLSDWCNNQRSFWRKGKLSNERIKKLESIGFNFE